MSYDRRMKKTFASLLAFALLLPATGCLVRTRTSSRHSQAQSCPPSTHWEDGECVHNGRGRNKDKHKNKNKNHGNDGPVVRDHK